MKGHHSVPPIYLTVTLLTVASLVAVFWSRRYYGRWLNPISVFCLLHWTHNWVLSFFDVLGYPVAWLPFVSHQARQTMLVVNLAALPAFMFGAWLVGFYVRNKNGNKPPSAAPRIRFVNPLVFEVLYFGLYVGMFAFGFLFGARAGSGYGIGQSPGAPTASTLFVLFVMRVPVIIMAYAIRSISQDRAPLLYILVILAELFLMVLSGTRKQPFMVFGGFLLVYLTTRRLGLTTAVGLAGGLLVLAFMAVFVSTWRRYFGVPFSDRFALVAGAMASAELPHLLFQSATATCSEDVQSWVLAEWAKPSLDWMWGKTYVQGLVNMFVPRQLQGELVQWQAAYVFKQIAYGTVTTQGYDFSATAEGVLNFGPLLGMAPYLGFGGFVGYLYEKWRASASLAFGGMYFVMMAVLAMTMRTDSVSFFRYLSLALFPTILFFWLLARKVRPGQLGLYRTSSRWAHLTRRTDAPGRVVSAVSPA